MTFADGHYQFVVDSVSYKVITQLMTPNQRNVVIAYDSSQNPTATVTSAGWTYLVLSEADYQ